MSPSVLRKAIILIFSLLLFSMPILQAKHSLTHLEVLKIETSINNPEPVDDDTNHHCYDCLVLKAIGTFLLFLGFLFCGKFTRSSLSGNTNKYSRYHIQTAYYTRAPPVASYISFDQIVFIKYWI